MSNKIQGEGDYESARRFNREEQEFVKRKFGKIKRQDDPETQDALAGNDLDDDDLEADEDTEIAQREELRCLKHSMDESLQRR